MGLVFIHDTYKKILIILSLIFISTFYYRKVHYREFKLPLIFFFLCCCVNMISCYFFRGQTFYQFLAAPDFINMVGLLTFFTIPFFNMNISKLEKSIVVLSVIFIFCYLFQYLIYPISIFSPFKDDELTTLSRPRIPGQALLSLCYFYYLNKIHLRFSWLRLFLLSIAAIDILILGFRVQILVLFILTTSFIIFYSRIALFRKFTLFIVFIAVLSVSSNLPVVKNKINQLVERQTSGNTFKDKDYIRYRTYDFYTHYYQKNDYERVMGTGLPSLNGNYGKYINDMKKEGIVWADWGLIGLSWILGIPGVLCIIWYSLKAGFLRMDKEHYYLKYWFLFMLFGSLLSREIFRAGSFAIQGIALYMISFIHTRYMKKHAGFSKYSLF